jgi:hypothetical protein
LGRVIKTENLATERNRLMKAMAIALRELVRQGDFGDEARDLAAFIVLALEAIRDSVERSVLPWEKRDYWLKADRFRMEWAWVEPLAKDLRKALLDDDMANIAGTSAKLSTRLRDVQVPAKHRLGTPWVGAWDELWDRSQKK